MANQSSMVFSSLLLLLMCDILQTTHATDQTHGGLSFRMIYRYSRESPLYQPNVTNEEMTEKLVQMSDERIQSLMSPSSNNSSHFSNPQAIRIRPSLENIGSFLYMVQVGIGTFGTVPPHKTYYLVLDTGSYSIWTQCQGCNPCFNQAQPPFPRTESSTYGPVPCNRCARSATCQHGHCTVQRAYDDGTSLHGVEAIETFTVQSDNNRFVRIPNIRFTCALRVDNFQLGNRPNNVVSGVFGMDRGESSFVTQIQGHSKGRFSYCLQSSDAQGRQSPMFLRFGDDIPHQWIHQYNTPLLPGPRDRSNSYYLYLQGISVGGTRLSVDRRVFDIRPDGSGGCLIDSGASVTNIIRPAYNALENVLAQYIEAHNPHLRRIPPPGSYIRLCYEKTGPETTANQLPTITFHFANNADFIVQPNDYMTSFMKDSRELHCFIMRPTDLGTVLGARQQVNHRIVYDLRNSRLLFSPHDCSSSN